MPKGGEYDEQAEEWKGTVQAIRADNAALEKKSRQAVTDMSRRLEEELQVGQRRTVLRVVGGVQIGVQT